MEEKKGKKEREKQDDAKVRFGIALFFFWPATVVAIEKEKRKEKQLLTATCPWACIRKQGTPRGPPLSGALPRRAPRKEVPLEGGGEQQFHSSTTTTTTSTTTAARATDDDDAETEEEGKKQSRLFLSFRAAPTTAKRSRDSFRWSKRESSSKPASFFRVTSFFFSLQILRVRLGHRSHPHFFFRFFRPPKGILLSHFREKRLLSLSLSLSGSFSRSLFKRLPYREPSC